MNTQNVIGTWEGYKTIKKDGTVKLSKKAIVKLEIMEGGTGAMKVFIFRGPVKWECQDNGVSLINIKNRTTFFLNEDHDELQRVNEDGSVCCFRKVA